MIPPNSLRQLHDLDRASPQFHTQLSEFIRGDEYLNVVTNLQGEDLAWLVEYLDSILVDIPNPASLGFKESLHELGNICSVKEVLPKSCTLPEPLPDTSFPSASGYVCEGTPDGSRLRIKRVRIHPNSDLRKVKETFYQVAVMSRHLTHPNIVPLLGATTEPLQFVSEWMSGGNLTEYVTNHPDADRLSLLSGVAEGLIYLHSCNVIHGGLKGPNILVDVTGHALITDFGLVTVTRNLNLIRDASAEYGDGARWIAPEILDNRGAYSKEADVFSFAMVTIEVRSGKPSQGGKPPHATMLAITGGERPPRPTHPTLTDGLWALTQQCWDQEAHLRPQVLQILRGFGTPPWKSLINCPLATDERVSLITAIFSDRNETDVVKRLRGDYAQSFVDVVDEMLDILEPLLRRKCLSALCRISGRQGLLPRSVQIPLCYNRTDTPLYRGGYADVWKGEYQGREVAVKVLLVYRTSNLDKITRRFCKEAVTWKSLCHKNVLPLLGVTMGNNQFAMVSGWMFNGNINEFIKVHRDANRFELLKDIVRGLIYMHGEGMIHGDLKGANVLIDQHGHARLADFGLTAIVPDHTNPTTSSSSTSAGTRRWMSPERLNPNQFGFKDGRPTKESDCYALGMVILEVLSGNIPFTRDCNDWMVMQKVLEGEHPGRPQGAEGAWFTNDLWEMLEMCWLSKPEGRPTVEVVLECLEQASAAWQPLPPSAIDDVQTDADDTSCSTASHPFSQGGTQPPPLPRSCPRSSPVDYRSYAMHIPSPNPLQRLYDLDRSSSEFPNQLTDILLGEDYVNLVRHLSCEDSGPVVEHLESILSNLDPTSRAFRHCLAELRRIHHDGADKVPPTPDVLSDTLLNKSDHPIASGTWARSHKGALKGFLSARFGLGKGVPYKEVDIHLDRTATPTSYRAPSPSISNVLLSLPNAKQLETGRFNLDELVKILTEALDEDYRRNKILQLTGDTAVLVIECLDKVITSDAFKALPDIQIRSKVFSTISRLSRGCQYLPRSYWIDPRTIILPDMPHTSGTCTEVYHGTQDSESVAVKVLRTSHQESTMKLKKAIVWKHVSCPYILKFNGLFYHNDIPAIVTPWMPHGNITEYLQKHHGTDRLRLLVGAVKGIKYLHSCGIAHGDIKAPSILISDSGTPRAMLAGFGFTRVATISVRISSEEQGTASFMAPELILPEKFGFEKGVPSKEADIHALGMTVYQVLTGKWPFYPKREAEVMHAVISGERPPKPENAEEIEMTEVVWELLVECWREDRTKRPNISEILGRFCGIIWERKASDPTIDLAGTRPYFTLLCI